MVQGDTQTEDQNVRSSQNWRACVKGLMTVEEAREVCKDRSSWRAVVSAYPGGKKTSDLPCFQYVTNLGKTGKPITNYVHDADILEKIMFHVGDMGRYQKLLTGFLLWFGFIYAFVYFMPLFLTATPENHWCRVSELSGLSMELRRNLSAPGAASGEWDHCMTFDTNWTEVLDTLSPPPDGTPLLPCQHGWEFEFSDIPYETVASERGWVCDRASYVPTSQSIFFAGAVIGMGGFGWIADRFGRVPVIIATNLVGGIGGIASIFTRSDWDFLLCRFLVGLSYNNCFVILYVLVLEYVGMKYRTLVANLSLAFSMTLAGIALPWMAYFIADWRILTWVTSLPMFVVLLAPWVLPESVKWLVSRGRIDEAVTILKRFEDINRTQIPDDVMNEFKIYCDKAKSEKNHSILEMCRSPQLRRAMVFLILLLTSGIMVFDGMTRLSGSFGLSLFAMFSLHEVLEFTAILSNAFMLDRFGRRNSIVGTALLCSILAIIVLFVPEGISQAVLTLASRFFIAASYAAIVQWSTEIIPTPFRSSGMAIMHMGAFAATMSTPFIVYSRRVWSQLPMVIFAVIAFLAAGFALALPETKGLPLPQTRADGENIIREHSLCRKSEKAENCKRPTKEDS